jgi:hypothetical protein
LSVALSSTSAGRSRHPLGVVTIVRIADIARSESLCDNRRHDVALRTAVARHREVSVPPERPRPFGCASGGAARNAAVDPLRFRRSGVRSRFSPSRPTAAPGRPCRNGRRCAENPIRPIAGQTCVSP